MTTDFTCDVITQLRKTRRATVPPIRMDILATSPYPTYTQEQLNMRRKAEILQYNANYQSTKQNGLTKSQKYAQIVNGSYQSTTNGNTCPNTIIYTPTSSSDVPGKIQMLYLDPDIPLYNYSTNRTYNIYKSIDTRKWNITFINNLQCDIMNNMEEYIATMYIRSGIDDYNYIFSLTVPVNITIRGNNNSNSDYDLDYIRKTVDIYIKSATCIVYYNDVSLNSSSVAFQVTPTTDLSDLTDVSLNTIRSGSRNFSANIFTGYIHFNNINLYASPGYSYDFKIKMNGALNLNDNSYVESDYYSNIHYYTVLNSLDADNSLNCVVSEPYPSITTRTFTVAGKNSKGRTTSSASSWSVVDETLIDVSGGNSNGNGNTIKYIFTPTMICVTKTFSPTMTHNPNISGENTIISDLQYPKSGYLYNHQSYYGSKTIFTLENTTMTVTSDGDPYPAKCGAAAGYLYSDPINDITLRLWYDDPNPLFEAKVMYSFIYRGGTNTSSPQIYYSRGGIQGMFANGVSLFSPQGGNVFPGIDMKSDPAFYLNAYYYIVFLGKDKATGHPEESGLYHYHTGAFLYNAWNNPTFYNSNIYYGSTYYSIPSAISGYSKTIFSDNNNGTTDHMRFPDGHSKIVGYSFDGYPIYGPFGYISPLSSTSGTQPMMSSYILSSIEATNRPYTFNQTITIDISTLLNGLGHPHSFYNINDSIHNILDFDKGSYVNDYIHDPNIGTLDECNGRYCVTPDYPKGTYAYFLTLDPVSGIPKYPYIIGNYSKQVVSFTII